jgi:HD-GYP domain-containing protein (c-di-GMP phosphodiesterase class II)
MAISNSSSRLSGPTLMRRFTLLSLGTTLTVGVLFGAITARLVGDFALRQQARTTAARVLERASSRLAFQDFFGSPLAQSKFEGTMRHLVGKIDIEHITVWNRRGQVLYSDARPGVETPPPPSALLTSALNGQLQWRLLPATRSSTGVTHSRLEVLVPVVAAGVPQPVAACQVISDMSDLAPALTRLRWSVQVSVVLGVLILYAILFSIVHKASGDLDRQESALRRSFIGIIRSLVTALDARDMATAHHSSRVADNAVMIAQAMGLDEEAVSEVKVAGFLHDVGKIGIRDDVLTKHGSYTDEERAMMQRHTIFGHDILEPVPISDRIKLAVRHSHERWDGHGYPDGLAGENIPVAARIVAVADAFEAVTADRPYRAARRPQRAVAEIERGTGTQFDPNVVKAFLRVWQRFHRTSPEMPVRIHEPA